MAVPPSPLEPRSGHLLSPLADFLERPAAAGIVLVATTLLALGLATALGGEAIHHFWGQPLGIGPGPSFTLSLSLHHWVNDGLMTLFFLLVGLELKREILTGELASLRAAALPVLAALGGMVVPALFYAAGNAGTPAAAGWGIPMATDIAFAIGILVMLGERVPRNLIIFLMALAIADDLGAVLVIALFYTEQLNVAALLTAGALLGLLILLNRGGVRRPLPYALLGIPLWLAVLASGVHATLAGILLAMTIPAQPDAGNGESPAGTGPSTLLRVEHALRPWVSFLIIPVFALANAGIDLAAVNLADLTQPVTLGVVLGLVPGKFLGICLFSWVAVRIGWGRLPGDVDWRQLAGAAWLGGIGFTMSLFISQLAFAEAAFAEQAKLGIVLGSTLAAAIGLAWLLLTTRRPPSSLPVTTS